MSSPLNRAELTLGAITTHLWAGHRDKALVVVQNMISVSPATPHQARANGAGWEIEIDPMLSGAYALPNLGAHDTVFTTDTERRWLIKLRKYAVARDISVVRKWQNRLMIGRGHPRFTALLLAAELSHWIVDAFIKRHVTEVEQAVLTLVGEREPITHQERWHVFLDDGREVMPSGRDHYAGFLDAWYAAEGVKRGTPGARYAKRPILWGTI